MKTLIDFIKNLKSFYRFYKDYEYNGDECEFIIENYQEVLCSRTKTMSKPTYYANSVIGEMDKWYEDNWKHVYKREPIERTREIGEPIDCSTLGDKHVIVADNEADRQALRDCFKGVSVWSAKTQLRKLKKK